MDTTKRFLAMLLCAIMLLSMLPQVPASAAGTKTLTLWVSADQMEWAQNRVTAFQKENPAVSVTIGICDIVNIGDELLAAPDTAPDVYLFPNDRMGALMEAGLLSPITGDGLTQVTEDNAASVLNTLRATDGKLYGVPMSVNTWFMYYNKDIFTEEDVKSLDAMLKKGKVSFPLTNTWYFPSFYFANGGTMFGPEGNKASAGIRFGGDAGTAVTKYLVNLVNHENFVLDIDGSGSYGFQNGTVGAMFSGHWEYAGHYEVLGDNLGAAQLPTVNIGGKEMQMKAFLGSKAFGVNPNSKNETAAQALAAFLGTAESQKLHYDYTSAAPTIASLLSVGTIASNVSVAAQTKTAANTSVPQPCIPEMNDYWGIAAAFSESIVNGEVTLENAAEKTTEFNNALNANIPEAPVETKPEAPEIEVSGVSSSGKNKVTWDKVDGAEEYQVYRATSKSGTYKKIATTSKASYTDKTAVAGKKYYYKVRAVAADETKSSYSNIEARTCDLAKPVVEESNVSSSGKIKLEWEKIDGAVEYEIHRATSKSGTYKKIATTDDTDYTDKTAKAGKVYYYKVKAIHSNTSANSAYSSAVGQTCKLEYPVVEESNVTSSGKIKLEWKKIEGAEEYTIYRATSKSGTYKKIATTESTSYTDKTAVAGKVYYYKVKAIHDNSSANSAYSSVVGQTCKLERPEVSIKLSSGDPKLTWDEVDGAKEYKVYRATSKSGTYKLVKTTTSEKFTDKSVTAGKTYYYKVKAIHSNSNANSAYSSIDSIKVK